MNKRYLRYSPAIGRYIPSPRPLDLSLRYQPPPPSNPPRDLTETIPKIESNHEQKEGGIDQPILIGETTKTISTPSSTTIPSSTKDPIRNEYVGVQLPKKPSPPEEGGECLGHFSLLRL